VSTFAQTGAAGSGNNSRMGYYRFMMYGEQTPRPIREIAEMPTTPNQGVGAFAGDANNRAPQPTTVTGSTFKFRLYANLAPIGWLGLGGASSVWACVVDKKEQATPFQWAGEYLFENDGSNHFLTWSALAGYPVACNAWAYANTWILTSDPVLKAIKSDQVLSRYSPDSPWLYANSDYEWLNVHAESTD